MISRAHRFTRLALVGCVTFFIIGLVFPQTSDAAIYKWRDDKGKLHFTDSPSKIPLKYQKKHGKPVYKSKPLTTQSSPVGSATSEGNGSDKFYAFNSLGQRTPIIIKDNTAVFAVATWCPYSTKLVRFLNDPNISSKIKHLDLIFIFKDEWPHIKKQLDKSVGKGNFTQGQADEQLQHYKKMAKGKPVYEPDFLKNLPGKYYFATSAATKLKKIFPNNVPMVYSRSQKNFGHNIMKWLRLQFDGQKATRDYLRAEFKKYNEGKK